MDLVRQMKKKEILTNSFDLFIFFFWIRFFLILAWHRVSGAIAIAIGNLLVVVLVLVHFWIKARIVVGTRHAELLRGHVDTPGWIYFRVNIVRIQLTVEISGVFPWYVSLDWGQISVRTFIMYRYINWQVYFLQNTQHIRAK